MKSYGWGIVDKNGRIHGDRCPTKSSAEDNRDFYDRLTLTSGPFRVVQLFYKDENESL